MNLERTGHQWEKSYGLFFLQAEFLLFIYFNWKNTWSISDYGYSGEEKREV